MAPQHIQMFPQRADLTGRQFPVAEILWILGYPGLKIVAGCLLFIGANWLAKNDIPSTNRLTDLKLTRCLLAIEFVRNAYAR
jgi:hypothetical protein